MTKTTEEIVQELSKKDHLAPHLVFFKGSIVTGNIQAAIIVAEKRIVLSLRPQAGVVSVVAKAMLAMLATYYIFHLQYPAYSEGILTFFQESVLGQRSSNPLITGSKAYRSLMKSCK